MALVRAAFIAAACWLMVSAEASVDDDKPPKKAITMATTKLFDAVDTGRIDGVVAAIAEGADVNAQKPDDGQTPLMFASLIGEAEIVKILLEAGADAHIGEKQGYTPLHGAAFQGKANAARVLLAEVPSGRVPLEFHEDGFHPIHRACWRDGEEYAQTVKAFLDAGVSATLLTRPPAGLDEKPQTPLQIAKETGRGAGNNIMNGQGGGNRATIRVLEAAIKAEKDKARADEKARKANKIKQDL